MRCEGSEGDGEDSRNGNVREGSCNADACRCEARPTEGEGIVGDGFCPPKDRSVYVEKEEWEHERSERIEVAERVERQATCIARGRIAKGKRDCAMRDFVDDDREEEHSNLEESDDGIIHIVRR